MTTIATTTMTGRLGHTKPGRMQRRILRLIPQLGRAAQRRYLAFFLRQAGFHANSQNLGDSLYGLLRQGLIETDNLSRGPYRLTEQGWSILQEINDV